MIDKLQVALASKLPPGSFVRNVVTLMTGTTFAQALMILVAPILTRMYTPEDFGVFALYTSVLGILAVVSCWRYELAIVLPEQDKDAANILILSILICFSMAGLSLILVILFRRTLANLLGAPELAPWLWFMPLSLLAVGLFQAFNYWSTRRKQFKRLALRQITQSTVTSATQLGTGALYPTASAGGLIGGAIVGQLMATGRLAWQIARDEGQQILSAINKLNMKQVLIRYKNFPIYSSWSGFLNTVSAMLPALLLGYFFNPAIVGYYALGHRVLTIPMGLIGGSIAQVFFPQATEARRNGVLDQLTLNMFQRLLAIGVVPIILITIVAPDLFALVFGYRWYVAGEYVRWLSVWILFNFISSPLSQMYLVLERQRDGLMVNVLMFGARLTALIIGGTLGDPLITIALTGITNGVLWLFNCTYILHMAEVPLRKSYLAMLRYFIKAFPYAAIPLLVSYIYSNSLLFVITGIGSGVAFVLIQAYRIRKKDYS